MNRLPNKLLLPVDQITPQGKVFTEELSAKIVSDKTVVFKDPISVSLTARTAGDGFFIEGHISACAILLCDGCLEMIEYPVKKDDFSAYIKKTNAENIDLTENIREDIILTLPLKCTYKPDNPECCALCGKRSQTSLKHDNSRLNRQLDDLDTFLK
ncbi:MAG: hypothetical protein H7A34_04860 [bacterium]|nr:hypothetical protein [bacterium]